MKIPRQPKFDSGEAGGDHLATFLKGTLPLKGANSSQTSVMFQKGISPTDHLEKLSREAQQLASEKDKNKIDDSTIVGLIKRKVLVQAK